MLLRLRGRDVQELAEYGVTPVHARAAFLSPHVLSRAFGHQGRAVALLAFDAVTPRALQVSMLSTDEWPLVARAVIRWGFREARPALLARGFTRAECRTMEGHDDAVRLLQHLGFSLECRCPLYGAGGRTFLQYAWRLNDHVHFSEATEDSGAPATAAA